VALVLVAGAAPVAARMPDHQRVNVLRQAMTAFDTGTALVAEHRAEEALDAYGEAAALFESLVADGVRNGKLYYNLGNTYLRLGRIGQAILSYRRAEELIGRDPQLQHNLRYARSLCRTLIEPSGEKAVLRTVFFWHYDTSTPVRFAVALTAYVLFWLVLIAYTFVPRSGWKYAAYALLVLWVTAGTSVTIDAVRDNTVREAVTVAADIVVRQGDSEVYDPRFAEPIHEGVECRVIEQRGDWYRIELLDGSTGWIRRSQAELI
jgi:hypothetical protein